MGAWKAGDTIESALLIPEPELEPHRKKEGKAKTPRQMMASQLGTLVMVLCQIRRAGSSHETYSLYWVERRTWPRRQRSRNVARAELSPTP